MRQGSKNIGSMGGRKKNRTFIFFIGIVLLFGIIFIFNLKRETNNVKPISWQGKFRELLPRNIENMTMNFQGGINRKLPNVSEEMVWEALRFILPLKGRGELIKSDDKKIFDFVEKYLGGGLKFTVIECMENTFAAMPVTMEYYSIPDEYCYVKETKTSIPFLAMRLYHEIMHAVDAYEAKGKGEFKWYLDKPQWMAEYAPTAAEIRFAFSLQELKLLPAEASEDDARLLHFQGNAMYHLYQGDFPEFYNYCLRTGMKDFYKSEKDQVEIDFK